MSRLDWFTIILVTLLLGALGFLIYRTVQLIRQDDTAAPKTEISATAKTDNSTSPASAPAGNATAPAADDQDLDDDELAYDPQEIEAPVEKEEKPTEKSAKTETNTAAEKKPASNTEPTRTASSETTPKGGTPTSYSSSSTGDYMVVAGSFSLKHNADNQVSVLKEMGYQNARVEMTKGGALASAMVDRFRDRTSAQKLVDELKGKGVDAIVKKPD